ncbi:MAG: hypothetical protein WD940_01605 [Patescibacteria group bacterium]
MKRFGIVLGLAVWALAYVLLRIQFSGGAIEIGRGMLGAYLFPFAPLLIAIALTAVGTVVFAVEAVRR